MLQLEVAVVRAWQTIVPFFRTFFLSEDVGMNCCLHLHLMGFLHRAFHLQVFRRVE